jgi:hypothetical protein
VAVSTVYCLLKRRKTGVYILYTEIRQKTGSVTS